MGVLDAFTGDPTKAASEASRNHLGTLQNNLITASGNIANQNTGLINTGYGNAQTNLGTGYTASTTPISTGENAALGYLDNGAAGAIGTLTANGGAYQPAGHASAR